MLLRRITQHVQSQNWFAVFIDFLIVVVGVFIGIQVANWNASLADHEREIEYLDRITADFENITERLVHSIERFDESVDAIIYLRSVIKEKKDLRQEEVPKFSEALRRIDTSSVPGWQSATYVEMQSAGDMGLIRDSKLQAVLTAYNQGTEIAHLGWKVLIDSQSLTISPTIRKHIEYSLNEDMESSRADDAFFVSGFDYESILNDNEFEAALSGLIRHQANNRALQRNQLTLAENVLEQLNNRKLK